MFAAVPQVDQVQSYDIPFDVSGLTGTSDGDLVFVEHVGKRVSVVNVKGNIKKTITIPGARALFGVARQGQVLFITDHDNKLIHVVNDGCDYITSINTGLSYMHDIYISNNTLWVTTRDDGFYRIYIDSNYTITNKQQLVAPSSSFDKPFGVSGWGSHLVVVCWFSHNLHILTMSGSPVVPPVGGQGSGGWFGPIDVVTDPAGRIYVVDIDDKRIVLFSQTGQFIKNLATQQDILTGIPRALYVYNNHLYVSTFSPYKLYVISLS
jgi:hypothetical protein